MLYNFNVIKFYNKLKMNRYICKYYKNCPSYEEDSVRCSFFYSWCKVPKQTQEDKIFNKFIEFKIINTENHPTKDNLVDKLRNEGGL